MWWVLACRPAAQPDRPGVFRVGPETPSVGIYDLVADADAVYVSNLHVPFVTVVDPATGARSGAFDLRDAGVDSALFPRLELWDGRLWVDAASEGLLLDVDLDSGVITSRATPGRVLYADDDGLYAGSSAGAWFFDGAEWERMEESGLSPLAIDGHEGRIAVANSRAVEVLGEWSLDTGFSTLADLVLTEQGVFFTDRMTGQVCHATEEGLGDCVVTGSDAFAIEEVEGDLLVTNRQGAALPESGAYEGAPGRVTRLTTELEQVWTLDLDKTIHFLAWDGAAWWTANEDALRLSRFTSDGEETLRGPPLGLTVDHLSWHAGELWYGSHLTDTVGVVQTGEQLESCGWPFQVVPDGAGLGYVVCQETGELQVLELASRTELEREVLAATFHRTCEDGLCTGHDALVGAGWSPTEGLLVGDPRQGRVLAGDWIELGVESDSAELVQHMAVVEVDGTVVAYEPRDGRLVSLRAGELVAELELSGLGEWPLVADGDRVWAGGTAFSAELEVVEEVEGVVVAPGIWLAEDTLHTAQASLHLSELRAPPIFRDDVAGPIRALRVGDTLWVAAVFEGTVECRDAISLEPLGAD